MNLKCPLLRGCWERRYCGSGADMDTATKYAQSGDYDIAARYAGCARDKLFALRTNVRNLVLALERRSYSSAKPITDFTENIEDKLLEASEMLADFTVQAES